MYSFTFTIPPFKKVYYNGKRRAYGSLSPKQQYTLLESVMMKVINPLKFAEIDWVYEKHEDGRLHIHGYAHLEPGPENLGAVHILRDDFYTVNQIIGMKLSSYLKVSDIQETYHDITFWHHYIQKNQDEIVFKNGYTQQKELTENLDNGLCVVKNIEFDNNVYRFKSKNIIEI